MNYALTQMAKGAYPTALQYFEEALKYDPNYESLEINLGIVNGAMGDEGDAARGAEAERHFLRALSLAPNDDGAHSFYGRWLLQHGRTEEAIAQLKMAVALNPDRTFQREQLIAAYSKNGDAQDAQQETKELVAMAPSEAALVPSLMQAPGSPADRFIDLSLAEYKAGQYQQSIELAQKALEADPKSALAYNNIGAGYGAMRQWDKAIEAEHHALELNPGLQIAANNLAWYTKQKAGGAGAVVAVAGKGPTVDELVNESNALVQAGQYQASIAAAKRALKLDPTSAVAWNNIAAANEAMHQWDAAIDAARKAVALRPDFQLAKNNLAWSISQKKLGVR
jgi:tetratricopeptide (TPR) repeat protein